MIDPQQSAALLAEAGYGGPESRALMESGIHAVDVTGSPEPETLAVFSSEPVDILGYDFTLDEYQRLSTGSRRILLVDTMTGAAFTPVALRAPALYGRIGLDAMPPPPRGLYPDFTVRARFARVGCYLVESLAALDAIVEAVRGGAGNPRPLLFRGQQHNYFVHRHAAVQQLLFGDAVPEVSLVASAWRAPDGFDYFDAEPYWKLVYQDILLRRNGEPSTAMWVESRFEDLNIDSAGDFAQRLFRSAMCFAHAYGIPNPGLAATTSLDVARWFAGPANRALPESQWPVVHIFQSPEAIDAATLSFPLPRAQAQATRFLTGAWSAHLNVCASDLLCTLVLSPDLTPPSLTASALYPNAAADTVLAVLLDIRDNSPSLSQKLGLHLMQYLL